MHYQGGKYYISKQISEIINLGGGNRENKFISLFCGTCSIETKINIPNKTCNDKHPYLIAMWKALQEGWIPPDIITEEQYQYVKAHKNENPALTGFVGFGCSFGGKWFGGFARNKRGSNYALAAKNSLLRDIEGLRTAKFTCLDYRDVPIPKGSIVFCDPPYENTTGYSLGKFDSKEFWDYMRVISKDNKVFICEQNAPEDFEVVWEQELTRILDVNKKNNFKVTEKLFRWKG